MRRKLRGAVPLAPKNLTPKTLDFGNLRSKEEQNAKKKQWFDSRYGTEEDLKYGQFVYVKDKATMGKVVLHHVGTLLSLKVEVFEKKLDTSCPFW